MTGNTSKIQISSRTSTMIKFIHHGSRLDGSFSDDSDYEYRGIFIPMKDEILLSEIPSVDHGITDGGYFNSIDWAANGVVPTMISYPLHTVLKGASEGKWNCIELLLAPWVAIEYSVKQEFIVDDIEPTDFISNDFTQIMRMIDNMHDTFVRMWPNQDENLFKIDWGENEKLRKPLSIFVRHTLMALELYRTGGIKFPLAYSDMLKDVRLSNDAKDIVAIYEYAVRRRGDLAGMVNGDTSHAIGWGDAGRIDERIRNTIRDVYHEIVTGNWD